MKSDQRIVHCTYSDTAQTPQEIIRESFRLFLQKELYALTSCRTVSCGCGDEKRPAAGEERTR